MASYEDDDFIIRKKKKPKRDKPEGLKLILKVGGSSTSTPEHYFENNTAGTSLIEQQEDICDSPPPSVQYDLFSRAHKKSKKKKKKKEKDVEKRDKKKHRKDKKKRYRDEPSQEDIKISENDASTSLELTRGPLNTCFGVPGDERKENTSLVPSSARQKISDKTTLQRLLEFIHQIIEKKDPHQFFAWPVTDQIAPGYSLVISQPMDLNSMKRNIENQSYSSLPEYVEDLQLMCRNAMVYNRPETIYHKSAKKLLHAALKMTSADKLRSTPQLLPLLSELSSEQLGFDLDSSAAPSEEDEDDAKSIMECDDSTTNELNCKSAGLEDVSLKSASVRQSEITSEDCSPDEILAQAKNAAKQAADKLAKKRPAMEMGFFRQKEDGSTTLAIIVSNDGVDRQTKERPVLLGSLVGKLSHGSGSVQGFREDKRNFVKPVKPLYYGAFGSYAPSYDSTFANLTREESQLLFQTYGDETAVQYAESIINFSKDCDYVTTMVDNLLDVMTGGDHRKTKKILEEKKRIREEEEEAEEKRLKNLMDGKKVNSTTACATVAPNCNGIASSANGVKSAAVSPVSKTVPAEDSKIEFNRLKSLSEYGIDTGFIEYYEGVMKDEQKLSDKLEHTRSLLERLHQTQYERLSAPLPQHLSQVSPASEAEHILADKVTENLTNIIKKVTPGNVAPVAGVRKAMGIAPVLPQQVSTNSYSTQYNFQAPPNNGSDELSSSLSSGANSFPLNTNVSMPKHEEENLPSVSTNSNTVTGFDLESELREFLESDSALSSFHLPDEDDTDKTIEQMLSAHS